MSLESMAEDDLAPMLAQLAELVKLPRQHSELGEGRKHKLILHVGTPKTGTTSIQRYLSNKQRALRKNGILYPHSRPHMQNPAAPTHQWFERNLLTTHSEHFLQNMSHVIAQIKPHTHTVIMSSEGIYTHWRSFPQASKQILAALGEWFELRVWVWFREPTAFIQSFYKQCIRNPQIASNPCYGKPLSLSQMLDIDWFAKQLDYGGFVADCRQLWGLDSVHIHWLSGDVVAQVKHNLGLATAHDKPTSQHNQSLSNLSVEVLKLLNQYAISAKHKDQLVAGLKQMDPVLRLYSTDNQRLSNAAQEQEAAIQARILACYTPPE